MKIAFHGAARVVTGSKHLLTLKNGKKYLLDCGMFQGMGTHTDVLNRNWGFTPAQVDTLILSHAHIDHSGLIPKLVKDGFTGKIYCTPATRELTGILLEDSAGIQEDEVKFANKRRKAEGQPYLQPLYTEEDAKRTVDHFVSVEYDTWHPVAVPAMCGLGIEVNARHAAEPLSIPVEDGPLAGDQLVDALYLCAADDECYRSDGFGHAGRPAVYVLWIGV